MKSIKRLVASVLCILLLAAPAGAFAAAEDPVVVSSPIFLNGQPEYTLTGSAGFTNIIATAMKEATGAAVALVAGSTVKGSLPAGDVPRSQIEALLSPDDTLVTTTLTVQQFIMLLNQHMIYHAASFPQLAGFTVLADKSLNSDGQFTATVRNIYGDLVLPMGDEGEDAALVDLADPQYSDMELTVVTTRSLFESAYQFPNPATELDMTLTDAFANFMNRTADEAIALYAEEQRIVILEDTVDPDGVIGKLALNIPSPVVVNLKTPVTVPDTVFYKLMGQDRDLVCNVLDVEIPYSVTINGLDVVAPVNVSLDAAVTQTLPGGRKTANTFDHNTIFIDLAHNDSLPPGSVVTVEVGSIYPPETVLYLYQYDEIGDIVHIDAGTVVDSGGDVSFTAVAGSTYVLNSRLLNYSTLFNSPSPENPFVLGIVIILVAFAIWVAIFFLRKRKSGPPPDA